MKTSPSVWLSAILHMRTLLAGIFILFAPVLHAATIHVDIDAAGNEDGSTWTDAFTSLQDGIADWNPGDVIWVAEGRYFPDTGNAQTPGDQKASFVLEDGMSIYGGFNGTENLLGEADPSVHFTVLSGDIDQNDQLVGSGIARPGVTPSYINIQGDNSWHVVRNAPGSFKGTTILDGLAITGGSVPKTESGTGTSPTEVGRGGGMRLLLNFQSGTVQLKRVLVQGNHAEIEGGGVYVQGAQLDISESDFVNNGADDDNCVNLHDSDGRQGGGGLYAAVSAVSHPDFDPLRSLKDVSFRGNYAEFGGGFFNEYTTSVAPRRQNQLLERVSFEGNTATFQGGGMFNRDSDPKLNQVSFTGNRIEPCNTVPTLDDTSWGGAGFYTAVSVPSLEGAGGPVLTDVVFSGNDARMYNTAPECPDKYEGFGGAMLSRNSNPTLTNVLASGNNSHNSGGAIYAYSDSGVHTITINNSTFAGNSINQNATTCGQGRAFAQGDKILHYAAINNSIFWDDEEGALIHDPFATANPGTLKIQQSTVQGCGDSGAWGIPVSCGLDEGGNTDIDPAFVAPAGIGAAPTSGGNYRLMISSPAVDSGDNALIPTGVTTDLDGGPRLTDGDGNGVAVVEKGAYELPAGCPTSADHTLRVKWDATGNHNGSTWDDALTRLQDALDLYEGCSGASWVDEIWVAKGVYYPDDRAGVSPLSPADARKQFSFELSNKWPTSHGGIRIYGGFAGTESSLSQRDVDEIDGDNVTVLSGDIDQDDSTDSNGIVPSPDKIKGLNSVHVVQEEGSSCGPTPPEDCPQLNGFTITGGNAVTGDASVKTGQGGGMWVQSGTSFLELLTFRGNQAYRGGGLYLGGFSTNVLDGFVRFESNWARTGGGLAVEHESHPSLGLITFKSNQAKRLNGTGADIAKGGGMYFASDYTLGPIPMRTVDFLENTAESSGGGLYTTRTDPLYNVQLNMQNIYFSGNKADIRGGAMANDASSPYIDKAWFLGNTSLVEGGAIVNRNGSNPVIFDTLISGNLSLYGAGMYNAASSPELTNVTFSGNRAYDSGGAMQNFAISNPVIRNSIAWQNSPPGIAIRSGPESAPVMSYSLIEGCTAEDMPDSNCPADGGGLIVIDDPSDPIFVAPIDPATAPSDQGDFHLDINSAAIDVGNNSFNDHLAALGGFDDPLGVIAPRKLDGNGDGTVTIDMGAYEAPAAGRIIVDKVTHPASSDFFFFELLDSLGTPVQTFVLQDTDPAFDSGNLTPGTYELFEYGHTGWDHVSIMCSDGSNPLAIKLEPGETVTCISTSVNDDTIVISKQTDTGSGSGFGFTDNFETPDHSFTLDAGGSQIFTGIQPGSFTIVEDDPIPTGYFLANIHCGGDLTGLSIDLDQRSASFTMDGGQAAVCTFINHKINGELTLTKQAAPESYVLLNDSITYTFDVENTGNVGLTKVTVVDPLPGLGAIDCNSTGSNSIASLAPSEIATCEAAYNITQADLDAQFVTNKASVAAKDPLDNDVTAQSNVVIILESTTECVGGPLMIPDGEIFKEDTTLSSTVSINTEAPATSGAVVEAPNTLTLLAPFVELNPLFKVEGDADLQNPPGGGQVRVIVGPVTCP